MTQRMLICGWNGTIAAIALLAVLSGFRDGAGAEVRVATDAELRQSLAEAGPGTVILIAPGRYVGGLSRAGLHGTAADPVVLAGANPQDPPVICGERAAGRGSVAVHLSGPRHVVLHDLVVRGFAGNGVNIDDGGQAATPATDISLERVVIEDTGPTGNHDALKMSGVDRFAIRDCRFHGWGGSAIDFVGCHAGLVEGCRFEGAEGYSQSNGVQLKGGSGEIRVLQNVFVEAGERAINLGGSTGLAYFRPAVGDSEAADIEVAGNRFVGGVAAVAWVTADGGYVHHNTFVGQTKWVLRILQENQDPRMRPCHGGIFEDNLVVIDNRVQVWLNVGAGTAPESFRFARNAWYSPDGRRPLLPAENEDATVGVGQPLVNPREDDRFNTAKSGPLSERGADAYRGDE
jgi:hypothetical protein